MEARTRREEYSEATRAALVEAARAEFAARGYAETSVETVSRAARVTRGALYHHFPGKQATFEAVVREMQAEIAAKVRSAALAVEGPWERFAAGFAAFLQGSAEPAYRRVVLEDAMSVLGAARWQEIDDEYMLAGTTASLMAIARAGDLDAGDVPMLTRLLVGASMEAALVVSAAPDPAESARQATDLLMRMVRGAGRKNG